MSVLVRWMHVQVPGSRRHGTFHGQDSAVSLLKLPACQVTVDPGPSADAGWNTGGMLNTLQATQVNGGAGVIDVTSTGQVQSWTVGIDDVAATASSVQANAAGSGQLLQTGG